MEDSVRLEEIVAELARDQKETRAALREAAQARNETEQSIKELAQAQKDTEQSIKELAQAQKDTEQSVKELAQIQTRTDESVAELSATVKDLALAQQQTDKNVAKLDRTVHAIGARWGVQSEASFREALSGILSDLGFEVENYIKHDTEGRVHGHPAQVEIDVVIRDGKLMLIEIKSSMNRSDVYTLERVVEFYEAQENRKVDRNWLYVHFSSPV